jgi:hypothetical protein
MGEFYQIAKKDIISALPKFFRQEEMLEIHELSKYFRKLEKEQPRKYRQTRGLAKVVEH